MSTLIKFDRHVFGQVMGARPELVKTTLCELGMNIPGSTKLARWFRLQIMLRLLKRYLEPLH